MVMDNNNLPPVPHVDPPNSQGQLSSIIQLEHRKMDIAQQQIVADAQENERLLDFKTKELTARKDIHMQQAKTVNLYLFAVLGFLAIVAFIIIYMAFWGNEYQREVARTLMGCTGAGFMGYVIISYLRNTWKSLFFQHPDERQ